MTAPTPQECLATFERMVRANDERVRVVAPRVMRRVISRYHDVSGFGFQIPTRQAFVIDRDRLLQYVAPRELSRPVEPVSALPEQVFLIGRPDAAALVPLAEDDLLIWVWRLLFEAHIEARLRACALSRRDIRERLAALGQVEADEIRAVLLQERVLLPPGDDTQLYEAFVAFYLKVRCFEPAGLSRYFPSLTALADVDELIARDVDAPALLTASRPEGAPDIVTEEDYDDILRRTPTVHERSRARFASLVAEGQAAAEIGNSARAALQLQLAVACAPVGMASERLNEIRAQVATQLLNLGERIVAALATPGEEAVDAASQAASSSEASQEADQEASQDDDSETTDEFSAAAWTKALRALLGPATDGRWSQEARLLYDLQKLCVENERQRYKLDLVGSVLTLGRRPLKRSIPNQQLVLEVKHLRSARGRLSSAHITAGQRRQLATLFDRAEHILEEALRDRLRGSLVAALDRVGLKPAHIPEEVAREKLIDELLDRAVQRGFLAIGDLRDALSRNHLKLQDLRLREFFGRDALLSADRGLAKGLEGIYRPGEVYSRALQRGSSLAFATGLGRVITRYLALPFGGAFVILEGLQHIVGPLLKLFGVILPKLVQIPSIVGLGIFLLGVLYSSAIRSGVVTGLRWTWRALKGALYHAPLWILRRPLVRAVLRSRPALLLWRFGLKPGLVSALVWVGLKLGDVELPLRYLAPLGAAVFLTFNLLLNSRIGQDAQEIGVDALVRGWHRLRVQILPGLVRLVLEVFKSLLGGFERMLYRVDEWLRFKQGENALALVGKAVLGAIWGVVTYIARIYITLLVEPQVNPIKHFPVVTVSHKIILPFSLQLTALMATPLTSVLGAVVANTIAGTTVFLLPGVFGFLVWELKENWKLYGANRQKTLRPVIVGGHGETISRFLRPGFHSGTLPKLYNKLRRAERRALRRGRWRRSQKLRTELHHVASDISAFVKREFVALVRRAPSWEDAPLSICQVDVGSNRIRIGLQRKPGESPLYLAFEEHSGVLLAGMTTPGWLKDASPEARAAVRNGLLGMYKLAGVAICREHLVVLLPDVHAYDVRLDGLVVWPDRDFVLEAVYHIHEERKRLVAHVLAHPDQEDERADGAHQPSQPPAEKDAEKDPRLPELVRSELRFDAAPLSWADWVSAWQADSPPALMADTRILPTTLEPGLQEQPDAER